MLLEDSLLTTLHISDISPHPDNLRKDLGDLEELTESIKKNGIMQNLTVVPVDEENPDRYICLIGHRRLAAAKAAGVYQAPARIVFGLTHKDQVGIMLEENMQRTDLTIVEQAQGFQMMLDLGETEETIAEKTGFSRTTVRHRLQLAKLDQKELKRRQDDESFQLSLKDLYALEKIKDIRKRNEILKGAYSSNEIRRRAENEARDEARNKAAAAIIKKLEKYGVKELPQKERSGWSWNGKWDRIADFRIDKEYNEYVIDVKEGEKVYAVLGYSNTVSIVVPKRKTKEEVGKDEKEKEINRRKKAFKELCKKHYEDRRLFVEGIADGIYKPLGIDEEVALRKCWEYAFEHYVALDKTSTWQFLKGFSFYELTEDQRAEAKEELLDMNKTALMIASVVKSAGDGSGVFSWRGRFDDGSAADEQRRVYEILKLYGYQPSEEEIQIFAGTHELYIREETT
mgnify:CR=1 FL=1